MRVFTVLVYFTGNPQAVENASEGEEDGTGTFSYVKLSRMNDVYQLIINGLVDLAIIRAKVLAAPNALIIGGWKPNGTFVSFPDVDDDFNRAKFMAKLKKFTWVNENGDTQERDYTIQELKDGIINRIYGWVKQEF